MNLYKNNDICAISGLDNSPKAVACLSEEYNHPKKHTMRFFTAIVFSAQFFLFSIHAQNSDHLLRTWSDRSGRELVAEFLYFRDGLVGLKLKSGREAAVGLETLSQDDQDYVFEQSVADVFEFQPTEMPDLVGVKDGEIVVTGGPAIYETEWFQFENEETVSKDFVHEAAQIFEATRAAIQSLPLGLNAIPPKGMPKFKAQFVTKENFQLFLHNSPQITTPDIIAGVYDPGLKSIIVPYDQIGARMKNGQMNLKKSSDASTLIHEITHQLMYDRLPLVPLWFSEGIAEYMASIPYHDGVYDFSKASEGLKRRLISRYGSVKVKLPKLKELLDQNRNEWKAQTNDYASSLVYTYYFMHLDQPRSPGSPIAAYLFLLDQAKNDTHRLISDYNDEVHDYNTRVLKYNRDIVKYRTAVTIYQSAVRDYNLKVDQYNNQLNDDVPTEELIKLGEKPTPPRLPAEPEMSEMLKNRKINSPINLFQIANDRARPSLLLARDYDTIEAEMIAKFKKIGIEVSF